MKNLKKILFIAAVGLGIGMSQHAFAKPDPDWCMELWGDCAEGSQPACELYRAYCRG